MSKVHPMFWPREPSLCSQFLVCRRSGQWNERTEDGHSRRPLCYLLQRAISYARRVVVQTEDECSDRIDVALRQPIEHRCIFARLVEALVHIREIERIDRLHADEYPFATRLGH